MSEAEKLLTDYQEIIEARLPEVATPEIKVPEFPHFTVSNPCLAVALAVNAIQGGASGYDLKRHLAILSAVKQWHNRERGTA